MTRLFSDYAYGPGPRDGCWWNETCPTPDWPRARGDIRADVAIIGGGFTGLSAALHLAEAGASVVLCEADVPGWGASGRNGGFCCLGGSRISDAALIRKHGADGAHAYWRAEMDAVGLVADLLDRLDLDVDRHSSGETQLAHTPAQARHFEKKASWAREALNLDAEVLAAGDLPDHGFGGGFFGAITMPVGFALNPRKYLFGLAAAAQIAGAALHARAPVSGLKREGAGWRLDTGDAVIRAHQVIVATNGYSSEDLPAWLAGRYLPAQSNVLVTRPLSAEEQAGQGWTSEQMAYDTRNLLHYFRLMPDGRFLFGLRGGLFSSPRSEAAARRRARRDFEQMFPAWAHVESPHAWSGMVCLSRDGLPFAGPVPDAPGLYAGLAYHGNGVAMGTFAGRALADLVMGRTAEPSLPRAMRAPLARFPFGAWRRIVMPPAYAAYRLRDLVG